MTRWYALLLVVCLPWLVGWNVYARLNNPPRPVAAPDRSNLFLAIWLLEESSGDRVDALGDSNFTLTSVGGTVGNYTTDPPEGTAAMDVNNGGSVRYVECTDANCGGTTQTDSSGTSFSYGCWLRTPSTGNTLWAGKWVDGFTEGYFANQSTVPVACSIQIPSFGTVQDTYSASVSTNTWYHATCVFEELGGTDHIDALYNGDSDGTTNYTSTCCDNGAPFQLGTAGGSSVDFNGQQDECFFIRQALTEADDCWITACGPFGAHCACNSHNPSAYFPCSTDLDCFSAETPTALCDTTSGTCSGHGSSGCGAALPDCNVGMS